MARSPSESRRLVPSLENLEDRWCPSASLGLTDDGHTLLILGDRSANHIAIVQDARGVQVTADGARPQTFTGIDTIRVDTGEGDDVLSHTVIGGGDFKVAELSARLGAGNDTFSSDAAFPPDPYHVAVDAGAGDDVVSLRTLVDPNYRPGEPYPLVVEFSADLGAGSDTFNADVVFHDGPSETPPSDQPAPGVRIAVLGGAGNDAFNTRIGDAGSERTIKDPLNPDRTDDTQTIAQGRIDMMLDGGDGGDVFTNAMRNLDTNGFVNLGVNGGAGSDRVVELFDHVTASGGLSLNVNGGQGNDDLGLIVRSSAPPIDGAFDPGLIARSAVRMGLEGGGGSDHFHGDVTPCIEPQGSLDVTFAGGRGADVFDLTVTMEPATDPGTTDLSAAQPAAEVPPAERDGPMRLTVLGGTGDDQLTLRVRNLDDAASPLDVELVGGTGRDTADVTAGINTGGWNGGLSNNHNQTFVRDA